MLFPPPPATVGFPRPHRRGRIETATGGGTQGLIWVSPGLTAGGGLKLI